MEMEMEMIITGLAARHLARPWLAICFVQSGWRAGR
jgi:hypothetical protein